MNTDDKLKSRRNVLKTLGAGLGAVMLLDCGTSSMGGIGGNGGSGGVGGGGGDGTGGTGGSGAGGTGGGGGGGAPGVDAGTVADAGTPPADGGTTPSTCVLDPSLTKGPYWVDARLNRSSIISDSNGVANPNPRPGLPLVLRIAVSAYSNGMCTPLSGAQVDIWHCDGTGVYSGVQAGMGNPNTVGQNFLRGYQVTDETGSCEFTTIYPGWYMGRAVHIHVKIRLFDASQNATTEATTQLFFDDTISDAVFAASAPYNTRGARDTRNSNDMIYGGHSELLVSLTGDPATGYTGTAALAIKVGSVFAG
ncbi:MAG TPA: intradiol ring-cleavage dioxygenase [Casimicrobiaceae bacterium]